MPFPLAAAIGAAIYILGRIILQFAIKVGTRIMTRYILPVVRASLRWLKEEAIDIGTTALFAAIQYVLDFLTGSTEELGQIYQRKKQPAAQAG